jgi:AraC-like DNA-binding protein
MRYEESPVSPEIAPFVERFWSFAVEPHEADEIGHVIPPDGCINIAVVQPAPHAPMIVGLSGPALRAIRLNVHKGALYYGLRLRPEAAGIVSGGQAQGLVGRQCGLYEVNPALAQALMQLAMPDGMAAFAGAVTPLIGAFIRPLPLPDPAVARMVALLMQADPEVGLSDILAAEALSERQMRRRFIRATGLTPKTFARIRRVRRAIVDLTLNHRPNAAEISFAHGFADQPHLAREVRDVFGLSAGLLTQYLNQIIHINLAERS